MSPPDKRVQIGSLVRVRFEGDAVDSLLYVSDSSESITRISAVTPMGHALLREGGRHRGEDVVYKNDKSVDVKAKVVEVIA